MIKGRCVVMYNRIQKETEKKARRDGDDDGDDDIWYKVD